MIPYIRTTGRDNSIRCNCDLIITNNNSHLILASLTDIQIKNKKVIGDIISNDYGTIELKDYNDIYFEKTLYPTRCDGYRYKSESMGNNFTHTVIYSNTINRYCINWNNEKKSTLITNYMRNEYSLPITEEIVNIVMCSKYANSIIIPLNIYTNNPMFIELTGYDINIMWFKQALSEIEIKGLDEQYDWDNINTIEEYLYAFLRPIKSKLEENITVLYNPNKINAEIFNGKIKPFNGQIPVIQSAIEILNRNRFVYLACEMGFGKSICAAIINHSYIKSKKNNYVTFITAPASTLYQWEKELNNAIGDSINIFIIRKSIEFIEIYNKTNMKFDKPTYFLSSKETFKLDCKKKSGVNIRTREITRTIIKTLTYSGKFHTKIKEKITIACCPDCGVPLQNKLRKTEDIFFTESDFNGVPKKSNYKCSNCNAVLWQSCYEKTKKTSLIHFIKVKNIKFDSVIVDEAHKSNNGESIIANATKTLFNYARKIILLSATTNSGYSSSMHNLLLGLIPHTLIKNKVLKIEDFIKTYGTLQALTKKTDGEYYRCGRSSIKESDYKEIEGVNPIVFTKMLAQNYIFATLDDLGKDLPLLKEEYVPIIQFDDMEKNENELIKDIKSVNAFNYKMYENSIVKHYVNLPFNWNPILIEKEGNLETIQPNSSKNTNIILAKERILLNIIKQEILENRKVCVYVDFNNGGKYMRGETLSNRLERLIQLEGIRTFQLRSSVPTYDRMSVLEKKKDDFDVLITNPIIVECGVNLLFIPTYINYMPSYMYETVTQSNRRGYRANAILENRIYHLYYENSIENLIIKRFQRKLAEAKAIESNFDIHVEDDNIRTNSILGKKINDSLASD